MTDLDRGNVESTGAIYPLGFASSGRPFCRYRRWLLNPGVAGEFISLGPWMVGDDVRLVGLKGIEGGRGD